MFVTNLHFHHTKLNHKTYFTVVPYCWCHSDSASILLYFTLMMILKPVYEYNVYFLFVIVPETAVLLNRNACPSYSRFISVIELLSLALL